MGNRRQHFPIYLERELLPYMVQQIIRFLAQRFLIYVVQRKIQLTSLTSLKKLAYYCTDT